MPAQAQLRTGANGPAVQPSAGGHSGPYPAPTLAQNLAGPGELMSLRLPLTPNPKHSRKEQHRAVRC